MLITVARHRLAFLVGVLVTAVILGVLRQMAIPVVSAASLPLLWALWLGLGGVGLFAGNAPRPETFVVREGTFTAPPIAGAVLYGGALTVMFVVFADQAVNEAHRGLGVDAIRISSLVLLALLVPAQWYSLLGPFGMFLRPDGIVDRQPLGSIFVPWQAGATAEPIPYGVKLTFARPDLVVRGGLRRGRAIRTGTDPGFTAWAIALYTARPALQTTIGTDEGLLHLIPGRS